MLVERFVDGRVDGRVDQGACFGVGDRQVRGGALTTPAADMPGNVQGA
ncbi:hypothetical protein [Denitromonas sp.]